MGGKNVFLGGASQGCGTALHAALSYKGELGGVIGTMGHLLTCTEISPEWIKRKIPIFVSAAVGTRLFMTSLRYNGLDDSTMKWEEWVKARTERFLRSILGDLQALRRCQGGYAHRTSGLNWHQALRNEPFACSETP